MRFGTRWAIHQNRINTKSRQFDGLRYWFPFNGIATDEVNQLTPTLTGSLSYVADRQYNTALNFGGTGNYLKDTSAFSANVSYPFSLSGWIRSNDVAGTETQLIVSIGDDSANNGSVSIGLRDTSGNVGMIVLDGSFTDVDFAFNSISNGDLIFVAGAFVSTTERHLYGFNATTGEFGSTTATASETPNLTNIDTLGIARFVRGGTEFGEITGNVFDVRYYEREITEADFIEMFSTKMRYDLWQQPERMGYKAIAGAGGLSVPVAMANYNRRRV